MEFIKKNKYLLILLFLALICLCFSTGHIGNILIDVGREMYYPKAILEGKVLYKDIFCIYGPLSYLLNALIYKILGAKLSSLYIIGVLSGLSVVFFTYKIARKFLSEFYTILITLFVISTGCLATRIFNFTVPYSYAVMYGLISFLISVHFLIRFNENNKTKNIILASFFAGFSIASKYDFVLYLLPLLFIIFKTKNVKTILSSIGAFLGAFLLPFIVLFIQGLEFKNLVDSITAIKNFTGTEALNTFYITQGVYYNKRLWGEWFFEIFEFSQYLFLIYLGIYWFQKKNLFKKILGPIITISGIYLCAAHSREDSFLFLTFLTVVFFILGFKKNSKSQNLFITCAILASIKSLWGLSYANYGLYYIPLIAISFFILSSNNFTKNCTKTFAFLLLGISIHCFVSNIQGISDLKGKIETSNGTIYTYPSMAEASNKVLDFINKTKEENPKIMVLPEGLIFNFLAEKKNTPNSFYSSLIPLYVEGFGENEIIENYKNDKPDYIILSNMKAESYQKGQMCQFYARNFCGFIYGNYTLEDNLYGKEDNFGIYKRKERNIRKVKKK